MKLPKKFQQKTRELCQKIAGAGGKTFLVGGCVRDLLWGTIPNDLDLEIFGISAEQLESLFGEDLEFVGRHYGIYKLRHQSIDLGLPRREMPIGAKHRDFHIEVDPTMSIREAAARRDFTINALYWDPLTDSFQDPFHGRKDLEKRRLCHISKRFSEDPLRVLRGMQFIGRFDLTPAEKTLALCRKLSPKELSAERIFGEFRKLILQGKQIGNGLEFLRAAEWLRYFPELEALERCQQDPIYHPEGSVFNHTKCAMDAFAELRPIDENDALAVGFAVLCHDFGKPQTTRWNAVGRLSAKGHEEAGMIPARQFLERMRAPKQLIEEILPLIRFHMLPRHFSDGNYGTDAAIYRLAEQVGRIDRLVWVAKADGGGRPPLIPDFTGENLLQERAKTLGVLQQKPTPILRGTDLLQAFQLSPSPIFQRLLNLAYEAQLNGQIRNRDEALEFLKEQLHAVSDR